MSPGQTSLPPLQLSKSQSPPAVPAGQWIMQSACEPHETPQLAASSQVTSQLALPEQSTPHESDVHAIVQSLPAQVKSQLAAEQVTSQVAPAVHEPSHELPSHV
jgi:hypothetical protein